MLYPYCPSCGTLLSDKQVPYEEGMKKICNMAKDKQDDLKRKLLVDIGLGDPSNYCCRMRITRYLDRSLIIT